MADPVSALATALQIAEAAAGVGIKLVRFARALKEVDVTTADLNQKLENLKGVVSAIETLMKRRHTQLSKHIGEEESKALRTTKSLLESCGKDVDAFTKLLAPLKPGRKGAGGYRMATQLSTQVRLEWNEKHIIRLENSIQGNIVLLQTLCTCSEIAIQGDAMYRLEGSNENIARSQARVQKDITKLRSTLETFTHRHLRSPDTNLDSSPMLDNFGEVEREEEILGRMKTAIEVTESLRDKMSTLGSASDLASGRAEPQRGSSNASTVEADSERNRHLLAQTHIDTPNTPQSSFATANSVLDDISSSRLDSPEPNDSDRGGSANRLRPTASLGALPLAVMEKMLHDHQSQAMQNLGGPNPQYEEAERNLLRSLEWGTKREKAYDIPFEERFDIGIKLAQARVGQAKFTDTEETLETLQKLVGQDKDKLGRWSCMSAKLYQQWFDEARDVKLLSKLEEFAIQSYNVALQSTPSESSAHNQNLEDSAEVLIAFFAWNGDDVEVNAIRKLHPTARVPSDYVPASNSAGKARAASKVPNSRARDSISEILGTSGPAISNSQPDATNLPLNEAIAANETGDNLLISAARYKSVELVRHHVRRQNVNSRDERQRSALHYALEGTDSKDVVHILLENGADVNATDDQGTTPLHICSKLNKDEIAAELIQRGADVDPVDRLAETPLQLAVRQKRLKMVQCLLKAGASVGNIGKHSSTKEINFLIKEHRGRLREPPVRSGTGVKKFFSIR